MTGCTGYSRRYEYNKKMRIWETCTILAEKEFKKLQDQADYNKKVDPLVYIGKLVMFVVTALLAILMVTVIIMTYIAELGAEQSDKVNPMEQIAKKINEDGDTTSSLLLTILLAHMFMGMAYFFIVTTFHGNVTVG